MDYIQYTIPQDALHLELKVTNEIFEQIIANNQYNRFITSAWTCMEKYQTRTTYAHLVSIRRSSPKN